MNESDRVIIYKHSNGYSTCLKDEYNNEYWEVYDTSTNGKDAFKNMVYNIAEYFGEIGSRHDEDRLYIQVRPGDKHKDYEKKKEGP